MNSAQIVAHANPGNRVGDFRLWESVYSKPLVFVDYMYLPHPHPLIAVKDVVFFDPLDKEGIHEEGRLLPIDHKEEPRKIAMNGFYKAIKHQISTAWTTC